METVGGAGVVSETFSPDGVSTGDYIKPVSKFDLTLSGLLCDDELSLQFEYCTKLFKEESINRFITYFKNILAQVSADEAVLLGELAIITPEEKHRILYDFNDTAVDFPGYKTIHRLFSESAARNPDLIALVGPGRWSGGDETVNKNIYEGIVQVGYGELERRSECLALQLRSRGVETDTIVAVVAEHSLDMIVSLLGILKAGGAYLPIDGELPQERIAYILADTGTKILVSSGTPGSPELPGLYKNLTVIDESGVPDTAVQSVSGSGSTAPGRVESWNLAYVMYTSGSTGRPRGVLAEHRNVVRLVKNTNFVNFTGGDRMMQTGSVAFDASTFEIWGSLLNGLTLYQVPREVLLKPSLLKLRLAVYSITTLWMTVALFNRMETEDIEMFSPLKTLLVGGDELSPVHINRLRRRFPELRIINGYGPTENTTFSTTFLIDKE
ncbi:MAG: AMP-binding protein, partial [bacterium]|nr:AMP-binding protein [bacterium]